jgi:hypothetical protein
MICSTRTFGEHLIVESTDMLADTVMKTNSTRIINVFQTFLLCFSNAGRIKCHCKRIRTG